MLEGIGTTPTKSADDALASVTASHAERDAALEALDVVRKGDPLSPAQILVLETIVEPALRPVVDILNDTYGEIPAPFEHLNAPHYRSVFETVIRAVGRVEVPGHPFVPYAGTAFRVSETLMMTNRHVAALFAIGIGVRGIVFTPGLDPRVDMRREVNSDHSMPIDVRGVAMIHPYFDCALIEIEPPALPLPILTLDTEEPDDLIDREVIIVGYPAMDPRADYDTQNRIFRGVFQKKRLQPGQIDGYDTIRSYGSTVDVINHDVTTLGGNSGSAIVDVETGLVLGLHFAGSAARRRNYAIPSWHLALEPRLIDLGVQFDRPSAYRIPPIWETKWQRLQAGLVA